MDSVAFDAEVSRLQGLLRPPRDWAWVAERLAKLLSQYPDGITDAIVRSSLQQGRKRQADGEWGTSDTLEFHISTVEASLLTLISSGKASNGASKVCHFPDARLLSAVQAEPGQGLVEPGRLLRLAGALRTEQTNGGGESTVIVLPTPLLVLVLQPAIVPADRAALAQLLQSGCSAVRGQPCLPSEAALVLRVVQTNAVEEHLGRQLQRVLMERVDLNGLLRAWTAATGGMAPAADPGGEVEVELVLWDEDLALSRMMPDGSLVCLQRPALLTSGDAEVGGAAAQLGYGPDTVVVVVEEGVSTSPQAAEGGAAEVGRLLRPPALMAAVEGGQVTLSLELHISRGMSTSRGAAQPQSGLASESTMRVEVDAPGGTRVLPTRLQSVAPGHHLLVCGLVADGGGPSGGVLRGRSHDGTFECLHNLR